MNTFKKYATVIGLAVIGTLVVAGMAQGLLALGMSRIAVALVITTVGPTVVKLIANAGTKKP